MVLFQNGSYSGKHMSFLNMTSNVCPEVFAIKIAVINVNKFYKCNIVYIVYKGSKKLHLIFFIDCVN